MGRTQRARAKCKINKHQQTERISNTTLSQLYKYMHALGWRNETALSARYFPHTGLGLCSKHLTFAIGDALIQLPLQCLVSVATLEADEYFRTHFDANKFNAEQRVPFQCLLSLYILQQQHRQEQSPLYAYLQSLPSHFSTPYFCTRNELQCLPESLLELTVAQNRKIRESYEQLQAVFAAKHCDCCQREFFADMYTLSQFKWAWFVVNTRSVYVNSRQLRPTGSFFQPLLADGTNLALAPFLDLFNHSDDVLTSAAVEGNQFVLRLQRTPSDTPILRPHTQLFISYGALPNLKLLTEYGFILPQNAHDYFLFSLSDIEQWMKRRQREGPGQPCHRNKFKFIREHNLHDQLFVHTTEGHSHNLHIVLHLLIKEQSHYPNVLNQLAFGSVDQLQDVTEEVRGLTKYKIAEYEGFSNDLQKISDLSESGTTALAYIQECVRYLKEYLNS